MGKKKGDKYADSYLYACDSATGQEKWKFETDSGLYLAPVVSSDVVYLTSNSYRDASQLYAVDAKTGKSKWRFQLSNSTFTTPAITDGTLYLGVNETREFCIDNCGPPKQYTDYLYTLDTKTGKEQSNFRIRTAASSPMVVDKGVVYFTGDDESLYAYDTDTGQLKWKFDLGGSYATYPAMSNGVIYVGSSWEGNLFAIPIATTIPNQTPTLRP